MGKASTPSTPDYVGAARETGQQGIQNTIIGSELSNPNTAGPYGSVNYTGYPGGRQTVTTNLSPFEQSMLTASQGVRSGAVPIAGDLENRLANAPDVLQGVGDRNKDVVNALYTQRTQYLDPQFAREEEAMDAQLKAQGAEPGTPAYNNQMQEFRDSKQKAYSDAMSGAQAGGVQAGEAQAQENVWSNQNLMQQLQQLAGYINPVMPGMQGTQGAGVAAPPNLMGAMQNSFESSLGSANAQNASTASTESALGSLALAASMYFCWIAAAIYGPSDEFIFARLWLLHGWKGRIADAFRWAYRRFGPWIAAKPKLCRILRPVFDIAVAKGRAHAAAH